MRDAPARLCSRPDVPGPACALAGLGSASSAAILLAGFIADLLALRLAGSTAAALLKALLVPAPGLRFLALEVPAGALRRILANLVAPPWAVAVRACRIGGLDRGPGIQTAEQEAVCRPFYRVEASRNGAPGGAGLVGWLQIALPQPRALK